jgi:hypothetical protein
MGVSPLDPLASLTARCTSAAGRFGPSHLPIRGAGGALHHTSTLSGGLAYLPTRYGRGIRSIEVRKIVFGMTVYALLDFPVLLKTEGVIAETSAFSGSWDAEDCA